MIHHPVLINGAWFEANFPVSSFKAVCPNTGKQLQDSFPVSSFLDLDEMLQSQAAARNDIERITPEKRAEFLKSIARKIEEQKEELGEIAFNETGLKKDEILVQNELPKMIEQLNLAAQYCLNRTWSEITIDLERNIRSKRSGLVGPLVIFGPSSSPFLFNSCGGANFAAAIAAGNSIIAKGNPNHPMTSFKLAQIIHAASKEIDLPPTLFQFFNSTTIDLGYRLAAHPMIGGISFTGSFRSGIALKESADRAGNPIFLEMSGVNPVFLCPEAVASTREKLTQDLVEAALVRNGQYCTKPGIFFLIENKDSSQMIKQVVEAFSKATSSPMLTDIMARNLDTLVTNFIRMGARKLTKKEFYAPTPFIYPNTVLVIDIKSYLKFAKQFQEEAFGPVVMFVTLESSDQFEQVAESLDGSLAVSVYAETKEKDEQIYTRLEPEIRRKTGRLINNAMPRTIPLSDAMVHGGPFPATGNPGYTSAGMPASIKRFTMLQCYQGVGNSRLPVDLRDAPPGNGTLRLINGIFSDR